MRLSQIILTTTILFSCLDAPINLPEIIKSPSQISQIKEHHENTPTTESEPKQLEEETWYHNPTIPTQSLITHTRECNIQNNSYFYLADPREFISTDETPRLGLNADNPEGTGNDTTIAKQRLMYQIHYFLRENNTLKTKILDVFPYRAARKGFGFTNGSNQTPTGWYLVTSQNIAWHPYGYINEDLGISGATLDMWNILDSEGNPIYNETSGHNSPHNRGTIHHAYLYEHHQLYQDRGTMGCLHFLAQDVREMYYFIQENGFCYMFISGSSREDLPELEQKLLTPNQVFFWENLKLETYNTHNPEKTE